MDDKKNEDSAQKCYGVGKFIAGCLCCPLFCVTSLLIGIARTGLGCFQCNCCTEEFFNDRQRYCDCYGIITSISLSRTLIQEGTNDVFSLPTIENQDI